MSLLRIALGSVFVASCFPLACSSSEGDAAFTTDDAGFDSGVPPTSATDAGPADGASNFERASRLEVACSSDPCYVTVSGNAGEHVCGLLKDGSVRCWGRDTRFRTQPDDGGTSRTDGALGRGHAVSVLEGATPAPVTGLSNVTQISVGPNLGTCARTGDGAVYCWGRNEYGQLGRPADQTSLPTPTRVDGLPPASAVALGGTTGCAIATEGGALWCWGAKASAIGAVVVNTDADDDSVSFPPQFMTGFRTAVRELTIGTKLQPRYEPRFSDTIVALLDHDVLATLGEAPAGDSSRPGVSSVPFELNGIARAGTFAYLRTDGTVAHWYPENGALYVPLPGKVVDVAITPSEGGDFEPVYVEQAGVLLSTGRLFRWGRNTSASLGYPSSVLDVAELPREMTHVAGDHVVSFAMTLASTCVSLVDGTVKCWGANKQGELGRGTVDVAEHPEAEVIR